MINKIYKDKNILKLIFFIFYIFIWGSIDTNFENTLNILEDINFKNIILFLR